MVLCPKCLKDHGKLIKCVACDAAPRCYPCSKALNGLNYCDDCDLLEWRCDCGEKLDRKRAFVWDGEKKEWKRKVCVLCYKVNLVCVL